MTGPCQPTAPWLLRWLLIVVTLAGVGLVQSTHCADGPIGAHYVGHAPAAEHHHDVSDHGVAAIGQHVPEGRTADTTAGHCEVSAPVAEPAVRAGTVALPALTACADNSAAGTTMPPMASRAPAVALTQLGVSRI
ncbi:hypothetical protein [Actinoplanes sp. NPDC049802]|uniref:hypothetical protein n=1 Tax=Actinoplanes sp. NPDC049802 TaxID=3154742 RepID=UPI0033F52D68